MAKSAQFQYYLLLSRTPDTVATLVTLYTLILEKLKGVHVYLPIRDEHQCLVRAKARVVSVCPALTVPTTYTVAC